MLSRPLVVLGVVAALLAAGCGGGKATAPAEPLLDERGFAAVVAEAVHGETGLPTEALFGHDVRVSSGASWVKLDLDESYARYRREPERRDEILADLARRTRERLERGLGGTSFAEARAYLMPLLKPRFAVRKLAEKPAQLRFLADLVVIYAVDRGTDFTLVTPADLARWGATLARVDQIARANLARTTEELLCEQDLCGWASGDGYDATRLIVPELRRDVVREIGPAVYAVPMEHVFVALPISYAKRIRAKVLRDFTTAEDPVSADLFVERNGRLVVLS